MRPSASEVSTSIDIFDRLMSHPKLTGAIFAFSGSGLIFSYFFPNAIPRPLQITLMVCVGGSGFLLFYNFCAGLIVRQRMKRRLHHLSQDEKETLRRFVETNQMTCQFVAYLSGPDSLRAAEILTINRNVSPDAMDGGILVCTLVEPWILRYLQKHQQNFLV